MKFMSKISSLVSLYFSSNDFFIFLQLSSSRMNLDKEIRYVIAKSSLQIDYIRDCHNHICSSETNSYKSCWT